MSTIPFNRTRNAPLDKPLPNNLEAERSVLAAVLLDNNALKVAADRVHAADFSLTEHSTIFRKMLELADAKQPFDLVLLKDELETSGQLEKAGGAPYLASLIDGMAKVSNVEHYAKIVREKSLLRHAIHVANNVMQRAFSGDATPRELSEELESYGKLSSFPDDKGLIAIDCRDFVQMDLESVHFVIEPILPVKGIGMIYAWRGVGKTFFTMELAYCVATGAEAFDRKCFVWNVPERRKVVYVDGEMDAATLQERLQEIARGHKMQFPEPGFLMFITPDLQTNHVPKINTKEGQSAIEKYLEPGCLLVLDNLSALCPSSNEDETGDWIMVQEWLLHLRRSGVTVLFMHHAGKGGSQRGFSGKEDLINVTINLRRSDGYQMEDQLRAEVHLEKVRGKSAVGTWVQPFEITLTTDNEAATWLQRPLRDIIEKRAFQMFAAGMKPNDVAQDLRLNRYQVYRLRKKFESGYQPEGGL